MDDFNERFTRATDEDSELSVKVHVLIWYFLEEKNLTLKQ